MEYTFKIVLENGIVQSGDLDIETYKDLGRLSRAIAKTVRDTVKLFPEAVKWDVASFTVRPERAERAKKDKPGVPEGQAAAAAS